MPLTTYNTQADMERLFSAYGVTAFSDHDQAGVTDTDVTDDCISQAAEEINLYAFQFYSAAGLATSTLVNRWATVLSVYFLCERRGNPVPESLVIEFTRIMATLERIRSGELKLPGLAYKSDLRPSFSNMEVDRRFPFSRVRVRRENSDGIATTLTQKQAGEVPLE